MTRGSVKEYLGAVQGRYWKAGRKEKGRILDEFVQVTGYHRKAAIRLLTHGYQKSVPRHQGRPKEYGLAVTTALKVAWEASDRLCSRRLQPFLPELVGVLERHGELSLESEVRDQLCQLSPATIDRRLRPYRQRGQRRPFSTTKPGSLLKAQIPIRTFADWNEERPGFLEVDLVAHCGESVEGILPQYFERSGCSYGLGRVSRSVGQRPRRRGQRHPSSGGAVALSTPGVRLR